MALLWATQIIKGKRTFAQVPIKLKQPVADILIEKGYEDLVTDEKYK